jgi:hypothetical protein
MPYFFETLNTPLDDAHLWKRLREIWLVVHADMMGVHFETEQEALDKIYRKALDPSDTRVDSLYVARYRETDDRENLRYFHEMGLVALGETDIAIRKRRLTPRFLDQWSVLLSSHGFVLAAMMARGDDMQSRRAGRQGGEAVGKAAQKKWVAHLLQRQMDIGRHTQQAERDVAKAIRNFVAAGSFPEGFEGEWFENLLRHDGPHEGQLKSTYSQHNLSEAKIKALTKEPREGLPPTDIPIPKT